MVETAKDRQAARYESEMTHEQRVRQQQELKERFLCCGQLRDRGHHEMCSLRPEESGPVDGQVSLL